MKEYQATRHKFYGQIITASMIIIENKEETECICGHSGDGKCHCCECEHQECYNDVYEETDMDEFIE